jgi:hypothetical protein
MKIQHHFAALLLATVLFAACNKEDQEEKNEEPNTGTVCRPSTVYLYGISNSGDFIDTLLYTYADAGVAKVTGPDYYFTFDYSGGRIVRRNYFDGYDSTIVDQESYETITYNSDGTVAKVESYYLDSNSPELDYGTNLPIVRASSRNTPSPGIWMACHPVTRTRISIRIAAITSRGIRLYKATHTELIPNFIIIPTIPRKTTSAKAVPTPCSTPLLQWIWTAACCPFSSVPIT